MKISRVSEMRRLDQTAVEAFGIREELLMENAGDAVYSVISSEVGVQGKTFIICCGIGNNGGDGLVIARKIHSNGGRVKVFILGDRAKYKGAARLNLDIVSNLKIEIRDVTSVDAVRMDIVHADAIVDAIFGTGLIREATGIYRDVIELINARGKTVISADIPSGVSGDSGQVMGVAVQADYTVTFGLPKLGNILFPGHERCGKLYVTHISFPPVLYDADALRVEVNRPKKLPIRDRNAHKGSVGQVLFIAGAAAYFGAPYFSALSFLKAGGGYSRLAAPASVIPFIAAKGSEIVFLPQKETGAGSVAFENKDTLVELAAKMDMVVLGPGLSLNEETQRLVRALAREIHRPMLIDGDGITAVSGDLKVLSERKADTILTPHLGEMSRLTGLSVQEIDGNKIDILQRTSKELNAAVVLKGGRSLIGFPDGKVYVNMSGNPGMASAGSGDVLTGTVAAMFGLGLSLRDAVLKGVFIHGFAGDLAAEEKGEDGMTAQDILVHLPIAMKMDRDGLSDTYKDRYLGAQRI
ncbi:MAG: ADP-dependent NAD(P)H-hydrate dehydratase / NAD(P)H-hydrate epimerase [Thermodesulfobacteriota bacterium]|nr:ADP-dependent NAD(P)H-hydrate dehydratase / NAD(P)H-hydrate epimerase [Thermodesulfobacteriota bacterium]